MHKYPAELNSLIAYLKKLPGVGTKTAERFAFHLLEWPDSELKEMSCQLSTLKERLQHCPECQCIMDRETCLFCSNPERNRSQLCIISTPKDAFALEETGVFRGLYHVIGGLLSPIEGKTPEHLNLERLKKRVVDRGIQEIIIALDSTLEGDTTALFLKEQFQTWGLSVSRLAFGLPLGSSLDFVDGGTLARALTARQLF
jgi:recombination protein RecR